MAKGGRALAGGLGCAGLVVAAAGIWLWRFYDYINATDPQPLLLARALIAGGCGAAAPFDRSNQPPDNVRFPPKPDPSLNVRRPTRLATRV